MAYHLGRKVALTGEKDADKSGCECDIDLSILGTSLHRQARQLQISRIFEEHTRRRSGANQSQERVYVSVLLREETRK